MVRFTLALLFFLAALPLRAGDLVAVEVVAGVYAITGPLTQRDPDNLGNNATFGLVVTDDGAVLIDAGASYLGAAALHRTIRSVTDQPVVAVINTGGQDHRWLGNGYWRAQGAQIIASAAAVTDQAARASVQLTVLAALTGDDSLAGTTPAYGDVTFSAGHDFTLGGVGFELILAPAHTPGDTLVWLPNKRVVFTGDVVFTERLLGVLEVSSSRDWVASFETMAALGPDHVVPGHGAPTDLATATHDTYEYLVNLRTRIGALIGEGGDILAAPGVDQSGFAALFNFDTLAGRNAQAVFTEMEWD
jgi:glyoxylase-like metal-dependent hydrolase (beta-lactamase superfamily II)